MSFSLENKKRILVVEDSPGDREAISRALRKLNTPLELLFASDGEEAITYIFGKTPDLVILDLNIPLVHGLDVLSYCKEHSDTDHIPIIVLSSSEDPSSVLGAYKSRCNMYLTKPQYKGYTGLAEAIEDLWLTRAKLVERHDI